MKKNDTSISSKRRKWRKSLLVMNLKVMLLVHTNVCLCTGSPSDSKDGERHLRAGNLAHSTGD